MRYISTTLYLNVILLFVYIQTSFQSQDEARLHEYLFVNRSYNPVIRPVSNTKTKTNVTVRLYIKKLYFVDEVSHKIEMSAAIAKRWTDELLQWKPSDFGGIDYIYVDYHKVWTPKLELVSKYSNENNEARYITDTYDNYLVKIYYNGSVEYIPSIHLTSSCLLNYASYPMDVQLCNLLFQTPYNRDQVSVNYSLFLYKEANTDNTLWDILYVQPFDLPDPYGNVFSNVLITLKRKVKQYIYTIPTYIVYTMTLVMFLLPQQSSQRVIIGATCLVIITMLTYMLSNSLPHNDISAWPLIGKLYLFNAIMLAFSLLFSAFIINISQIEHLKSVPDWLKKLTVNFLSKVFCIKSVVYAVFNSFDQKVYEDETMEIEHNSIMNNNSNNEQELQELNSSRNNNNTDTNNNNNNGLNNHKTKELLKRIYNHIQQIRYNYQKYSYKHNVNNEWLLIASLIDRILFLAYSFIVILSTFIVLRSK